MSQEVANAQVFPIAGIVVLIADGEVDKIVVRHDQIGGVSLIEDLIGKRVHMRFHEVREGADAGSAHGQGEKFHGGVEERIGHGRSFGGKA